MSNKKMSVSASSHNSDIKSFRVDFFATEDFELFDGSFEECLEEYDNHPLGILNIVEIDDDYNEVRVWL